jgi:hypothetical protein
MGGWRLSTKRRVRLVWRYKVAAAMVVEFRVCLYGTEGPRLQLLWGEGGDAVSGRDFDAAAIANLGIFCDLLAGGGGGGEFAGRRRDTCVIALANTNLIFLPRSCNIEAGINDFQEEMADR